MKVLLLFETTGLAAQEFERLGIETICVDIVQPALAPLRTSLCWDVLEKEQELIEIAKTCVLVFGMPPCTDLTSTGAKHFRAKAAVDPDFQIKAVHVVRSVERIGVAAGVPWAIENPFGVITSFWRKWNFRFEPWEYGGYLPEDDRHPLWPKYIAPRDAYPKRTGLWTGNKFTLPKKLPITPERGWARQVRLLGGKGAFTKTVRSASPRGFFRALAISLVDKKESSN